MVSDPLVGPRAPSSSSSIDSGPTREKPRFRSSSHGSALTTDALQDQLQKIKTITRKVFNIVTHSKDGALVEEELRESRLIFDSLPQELKQDFASLSLRNLVARHQITDKKSQAVCLNIIGLIQHRVDSLQGQSLHRVGLDAEGFSATQSLIIQDDCMMSSESQQSLPREFMPLLVDSMMAATVLKTPPSAFVRTSKSLCRSLQPLWENMQAKFAEIARKVQEGSKTKLTTEEQTIVQFLHKTASDAIMPEQFITIGTENQLKLSALMRCDKQEFVKLQSSAEEFSAFLQNLDQENSLGKLSLCIKVLGGALTDIPGAIDLLDSSVLQEERKGALKQYIEKCKPAFLFAPSATEHRGRLEGVRSDPEYASIGLMYKSELECLPSDLQDRLSFKNVTDKLHFQRKHFRNAKHANGSNSLQTANGFPLIAGPSGSIGLFLIAACAVQPELLDKSPEHQKDLQRLIWSGSSFLVGGGYHSFYECFALAHYGINLPQTLEIAAAPEQSQREFDYFREARASFMPYRYTNSTLFFDPQNIPAELVPAFSEIASSLVQFSQSSKSLIDYKLKEIFIQQFMLCMNRLANTRRMSHENTLLLSKLAILAAKLVHLNVIERKTFDAILSEKMKAYPEEKTKRREINDVSIAPKEFSKKLAQLTLSRTLDQLENRIDFSAETLQAKTEMDRFLQKYPEFQKLHDDHLKSLKNLPAGYDFWDLFREPHTPLNALRIPFNSELELFSSLAASSQTRQDKAARLEEFAKYCKRRLTQNMVYHNPMAVFALTCRYLERQGVLQDTASVRVVPNGPSLHLLDRRDQVIKGYFLSFETIASLTFDSQPHLSLESRLATQIALLEGAIENPKHHDDSSVDKFVTFLERHFTSSQNQSNLISLSTTYLTLLSKAKPVPVRAEKLTAKLKTMIESLNGQEKQKACKSFLDCIDISLVPKFETFIQATILPQIFTEFDESSTEAMFDRLFELRILSEKIKVDATSFPIYQILFTRLKMLPSNEVCQLFSNERISVEEQLEQLLQEGKKLHDPTKGFLEVAQFLNLSSQKNRALYYLAHFKQDPLMSCVSYAYTFGRFEMDLFTARPFTVNPTRQQAIRNLGVDLTKLPQTASATKTLILTPKNSLSLVNVFRILDASPSCLLSRNKMRRQDRVAQALSPEILTYEIRPRHSLEKKSSGWLLCMVGSSSVGEKNIPTFFVTYASQNLTPDQYKEIVEELTEIGASIGCQRIQFTSDTKKDNANFSEAQGLVCLEEVLPSTSGYQIEIMSSLAKGDTLLEHTHSDLGEILNEPMQAEIYSATTFIRDVEIDLRDRSVLPAIPGAAATESEWRAYQKNLNCLLKQLPHAKYVIGQDGTRIDRLQFQSDFHRNLYRTLQDIDLAGLFYNTMKTYFEDHLSVVEVFFKEIPDLANYLGVSDNEWAIKAFNSYVDGSAKRRLATHLKTQFALFINAYQEQLKTWVGTETSSKPFAILTQDGGMTHQLQAKLVSEVLGPEQCAIFNESTYQRTPMQQGTRWSHSDITNYIKSDSRIPGYKDFALLLQRDLQTQLKDFIPDTSRRQLRDATKGAKLIFNTNTWAHNVFIARARDIPYYTLDQAHNDMNYCIKPLVDTATKYGVSGIHYLGQLHTVEQYRLSSGRSTDALVPIQPLVDPSFFTQILGSDQLHQTLKTAMTGALGEDKMRLFDRHRPTLFISTGGQVAGKNVIEQLIKAADEKGYNVIVLCSDQDNYRTSLSAYPHVFALPKVSNELIASAMLYSDVCFVKAGSPMVNQALVCKQQKPQTRFMVLDDFRTQEQGNIAVLTSGVGAPILRTDASPEACKAAFFKMLDDEAPAYAFPERRGISSLPQVLENLRKKASRT